MNFNFKLKSNLFVYLICKYIMMAGIILIAITIIVKSGKALI